MSKKIVNGKFVERTPEEEVELQRLRDSKAEHYANVGKANQLKKRPKIGESFVALPWRLADKLNNAGLLTRASGVFLILLDKKYRHQGPFQLPVKDLDRLNIDRSAQTKAIATLEELGFISVVRKHKHPPTITVL
jgi:hypothetical protein